MAKIREVRDLKIPLALLAVALAAVLFILSADGPQKLSLTIGQETPKNDEVVTEEPVALPQVDDPQNMDTGVEDLERITMISPRFIGENQSQGKWEITARKAHQDRGEEGDTFLLERVQASAKNHRGTQLTFLAEEGTYNQLQQVLGLQKNVVVGGYGFRLTTESLAASVVSRTAWTKAPVQISGREGTLTADEMRVTENGALVEFNRNIVTNILLPETQDKIVIKSDTLNVKQKEGEALFKSNVQVENADMIMNSNDLQVLFYTDKDDQKSEDDSALKQVIATGNINMKFTEKDETAQGKRAIYDPKTHTMTLMDEVVLMQGENKVNGDTLIYDLNTRQMRLKAGTTNDGRIKARVVPDAQ